MKVTFLGTGTSQGVPVIACSCEVCQSVDFRDKRLRSSVFIEVDGVNLVIDSGPDFRQQMLRERVKKLDAILFTHEHKDHVAGLDDVRSFNFLQKKDMPIYAQERVLKHIKNEFAYAFAELKYPGVPQITANEIATSAFDIEGVSIQPIEVMHYKLPVLAFRIKDFTYVTDANFISEEGKEQIRGSKVMVVNALQSDPHISHFTLPEAIDLVQELEIEQAYFTHISHKLGRHAKVSEQLPDGVQLAYDGLTLEL